MDGDELISSSAIEEKRKPAQLSLGEIFEQNCPFYLSIGMTPNEYWNGDPKLVRYYREAYKIKRDRKNYEMFLQGAYFYDALCLASPILHYSAKKGTKPHPYLEYPYPLSEEQKQQQEEDRARRQYEARKKHMHEVARASKEEKKKLLEQQKNK